MDEEQGRFDSAHCSNADRSLKVPLAIVTFYVSSVNTLAAHDL